MKQTWVATFARFFVATLATFLIVGCGGGNISVNIPQVGATPSVTSKEEQSLIAFPPSLSIASGNRSYVVIEGGVGSGQMTAMSSEPSICTAEVTGSTLIVVGVSPGNCNILVKKDADNKYNSANIKIGMVVAAPADNGVTTMVTTPTVVKTAVNGQILVKVSQPGEQYPLDNMKPQASSDSKVCSATWLNGNSFKVNGVSTGNCVITFYSKDGTSGIIPVTVIAWMEDTISPTGWPATIDGVATGYLEEVCDNVILDGVSTSIQNPLTEIQTGITSPGSRAGCYKPSMTAMSVYPFFVYNRTDWERQLTKDVAWSFNDQCSFVVDYGRIVSDAYFAWQLQPSETCDLDTGLNSAQWGNYLSYNKSNRTWEESLATYIAR